MAHKLVMDDLRAERRGTPRRRTIIRRGGALRPANTTVATLGDSRTEHNSTPAAGYENLGYINYLRYLTGQAFYFPTANNFGVVGDETTQVLARTAAALAASNAGTFVVFSSINDRTAGRDFPTTVTALAAIRDLIRAAGRIVWFIAEEPVGDTTFTAARLTGQQLQNHLDVHRWLLDQHAPASGVYVSDPWPLMENVAGGIHDAIVGMTYDGVHPAPMGALAIAKAMKPIADALFVPVDLVTPGVAAALNANPSCAGTAGTNGTGGSGQLATSWSGANSTGAAAATRVNSKVGAWQQIVIGGTPAGATPSLDLMRQVSLAGLVQGDVVECVGEIEVDAGAFGVTSVELRIIDQTNGVTVADLDRNVYVVPTEAQSGVMRSPRYTIPAGGPDIRIALTAYLIQGTACGATVRAKNLAAYKV